MKTATEPLVEMKGVKLQFDDKVILKNLNLTLQKQDVLVVMGASGSGKSTLLRLLLGLLPAQGGSIRFKEKEITQLPRPQLNIIRTKIGMVYQNSALIGSLNVHDNIALPLRELSDKKKEEIEKIIAEKLQQVGLEEVNEKLPSELSGGMKKRVGLARALVLEPELILFDEPSAGLDPINSKLIDELIIGLKEKHHVTSIVVTHEMASAFAIASRMAMLHEGEMIAEGSPEEFRNSTNPVVQKFLAPYFEAVQAEESVHANSSK